jgi:hypothetical protein
MAGILLWLSPRTRRRQFLRRITIVMIVPPLALPFRQIGTPA